LGYIEDLLSPLQTPLINNEWNSEPFKKTVSIMEEDKMIWLNGKSMKMKSNEFSAIAKLADEIPLRDGCKRFYHGTNESSKACNLFSENITAVWCVNIIKK
jgi:hypothetical protein